MILLPVWYERMVVAFCAADVHAEEQHGGVVREIVQFANASFEEFDGTLSRAVCFGGHEHFPKHFAPWLTFPDRREQILAEFVIAWVGRQEQFVERISKVKFEVGQAEETVDELDTARLCGDRQVPLAFRKRRNAAGRNRKA